MKPQDLLPLIDPKINPKYSPNLHAWIKKQWGGLAVHLVVTNPGLFGARHIGRLEWDGWLGCSNLNSVLCNGAKETTYAISNKNGIDTTFFERYIRDGRCTIDPEHNMHFIGDETRWRMHPNGSARECLWCGHHVQVKLDWTETVHKSEWVPA